MSRTIRRKGWNYWESAAHDAVKNNPLFGNKGWIIRANMPIEYQRAIAGQCMIVDDVASFIHRDLHQNYRQDSYKYWLDYKDSGIRTKQRNALKKVMEGFEYPVDEKSIIKAHRGIAEWVE
ncbi:hypothetical protein PS2_112 [Serratia phage PS2]|uniref:Uncharacterized protein n=1 Tax=Serratia phage PS2 TaxID=1481112 RepID=A0A023W5M0_9CAUD|nr:hypothetical protein FF83_gp112 [Serratia phage PS2]AHY25358.1 hypothetical protein PS2_112 [Serratia phage PS2]